MVLVMTVKTLCVGNAGGKFMPGGIASFGWINGLVFPLIASIIVIKYVTGGTTGCPVEPSPPRAGRVDMASQAAFPQKIIHQHARHLRIDREVRFRQRF